MGIAPTVDQRLHGARSPAGLALWLSVAAFLFIPVQAGRAQATSPSPQSAPTSEIQKDTSKDAAKETPIPPEKAVPTPHELTLEGKSLKYTATAGTLLIRDKQDKPYGSIFYVAYTLDGEDPSTRPVSFL